MLADLRDAISGTPHAGLAEKQAQKLRKDNPNARGLVASLRKRKLLAK